MSDYTIEQFESDFEEALNDDSKRDILNKLLESGLDIFDPEVKEKLEEYTAKLEDYKKDLAIEVDSDLNRAIADGKYKLHTCLSDYSASDFSLVCGRRYYVKFDDVASEYRSTGIAELSEELANMINNIKPIVFVCVDDGIGTLKRRVEFNSDDFTKYFELCK
jgi:hypothetical protein